MAQICETKPAHTASQMLSFIAALGLDQITCKASCIIDKKKYEVIQTCPATDKCFAVTAEDIEKIFGASGASDVSGGMCAVVVDYGSSFSESISGCNTLE